MLTLFFDPYSKARRTVSEGAQVLEKAGCSHKGRFFTMGWSSRLDYSLWFKNLSDFNDLRYIPVATNRILL